MSEIKEIKAENERLKNDNWRLAKENRLLRREKRSESVLIKTILALSVALVITLSMI